MESDLAPFADVLVRQFTVLVTLIAVYLMSLRLLNRAGSALGRIYWNDSANTIAHLKPLVWAIQIEKTALS